jgi:four helix bundle protein
MLLNRTHRHLVAWQQSVSLASRTYAVTSRFPNADTHALAIQMRRCALSIASNIAEGAACGSRVEYLRRLDASRASLSELETQVCIGIDLHLLEPADGLAERITEVRRLVAALGRTLREHRERALAFAQIRS